MASVFLFLCIHGSCGEEEIRKSNQQSSQLLLHPLIQMTHSAQVTQQRCAPSEPAGPAAVPGAETSLSQEERQRARGYPEISLIHPPRFSLSHSPLDLSLISLPPSIYFFISSFLPPLLPQIIVLQTGKMTPGSLNLAFRISYLPAV